ncbi:MAG: phosphoribosylformylglycinamidine synthase [Prevotellaceae bacterium]|jgi:phosphoribosylformylglycinamidine synthase|nr:phosphoribosylformylglycinamidine synthase [Prevotellaceae bacterium]
MIFKKKERKIKEKKPVFDYRIFVEKKPNFRIEVRSLQYELNQNLNLNLQNLRLINVYDLFCCTEDLFNETLYGVFGETVTDNVSTKSDYEKFPHLAVEYLPGQFDQRANSAVDCVKLHATRARISIKSSKILIFDKDFPQEDIEKVKKYFINPIETREKDLSVLENVEQPLAEPPTPLENFISLQENELDDFRKQHGLAMNNADLQEIVNYFKAENREPYEAELRILDTYWSDHCRHTTFTTILQDIEIEDSFISEEIKKSLNLYHSIRVELKRQDKDICLMDIATIGARYLKSIGCLEDLEKSEENNACSIFIDVEVERENPCSKKLETVTDKYLLQFKNETHNHPTEIEPFGGASTCLGGAIRDPLSGRSYVYQAMRVTGAGDIYQPVNETIDGKLPQKIISTKAARGYSSYGNQIGLATTHVREIYHENYVAKRLEVGAVVGAVKADYVRRESPEAGDLVLMFGGRTGRDGIGGATGSSKEHTAESLEKCSSEVQKGNAPEERKLQHLFRRKEVVKLVKKSNDFGAGGVCVAIGELADGLDIYLDNIKTKYTGLSVTELAISESQERMAAVVAKSDSARFIQCCAEENIEVVIIATVTDTNRLRMFHKGAKYVDISREFIDSAGAKHFSKAKIAAVEKINPFERNIEGKNLREKVLNNLADNNVISQKGLIEMFDSTIGRSTVLMPFGGETQRSETQVSVQKIPIVKGETNTASIMAFGYNPFLTSWSCYHGAQYAVVEAMAKMVSAGARHSNIRFSFQEYFEKMTEDSTTWGKPLAALLGGLQAQVDFKLPSIGGKDSMSGTFGNINVPPMLMAFGVSTVNANKVISTDLKQTGNSLFLIKHTPKSNFLPDYKQLIRNFAFVAKQIENKVIVSAYAIGFGGIAEAICKMSFGNNIGANVKLGIEDKFFEYNYGSILIECKSAFFEYEDAVYLGTTIRDEAVYFNDVKIPIEELYQANTEKFEEIYPITAPTNSEVMSVIPKKHTVRYRGFPIELPIAYLPVFEGTNCDYDTAKAFKNAGAEVTTSVFRNQSSHDIRLSLKEMKRKIADCQILVISGGFSAGDEPDGSGKYIANILTNEEVAGEINKLIERGGLILGICNGFQALIKSGLLPFGKLGKVTEDSPTLFRNDNNRHISMVAATRVSSINSPWLSGFKIGEIHKVAMSHGEGKVVVSEKLAKELFKKGQIAFQYVDLLNKITVTPPYNPNGSMYAIEGMISDNGLILGKMGHSERYEQGLLKNIYGEKRQDIFRNAVKYFMYNLKKNKR